jgi:hypothetical protein
MYDYMFFNIFTLKKNVLYYFSKRSNKKKKIIMMKFMLDKQFNEKLNKIMIN